MGEQIGNTEVDNWVATVTPLDVGIAMRADLDRFWIAPWIGEHVSIGHVVDEHIGSRDPGDPTTTSLGSFAYRDFIEVGLTSDVRVVSYRGNALSLYADYHTNIGGARYHGESGTPPFFAGWSQLSIGLALVR